MEVKADGQEGLADYSLLVSNGTHQGLRVAGLRGRRPHGMRYGQTPTGGSMGNIAQWAQADAATPRAG